MLQTISYKFRKHLSAYACMVNCKLTFLNEHKILLQTNMKYKIYIQVAFAKKETKIGKLKTIW